MGSKIQDDNGDFIYSTTRYSVVAAFIKILCSCKASCYRMQEFIQLYMDDC
ncbi:hypothetical protein NSE_0494 [Neorickettsia sennetsu str. Miyayama]|uniref:Uncharacterized protein n=1 Tax=Ehrlichia sennetsu (strain ATCC VR-367 / Miyayama) TaxID=222891 RepID=Q2GDR8_EHRS3|nr:hypothetical protein NSE_0494 [Neorickettsia sennetsu str. Miyayama]